MSALDTNDRIWRALLWGGASAGVALLAWEIFDYFQDVKRPGMRANDAWSAASSIALVMIVGVIAARRAQRRREAAAAAGVVQKREARQARHARKRGAGRKRAGRRKGRT